MKIDRQKLDEVISRYEGKAGRLLGILEDAQKLDPHKYLSQEVLEYIAEKTGIPVSKIYNIITFYAFFNLTPQGDHSIIVCRGTACHTRRSKNLLDYLIRYFGFSPEELAAAEKSSLTTKDNQFTVKTVACFGQCALAPVVEIDGNIYSHMNEDKLGRIIKGILSKKAKK